MLDENLKHLLGYINKTASDRFAIITADEIIPTFPQEYSIKKEDLFDMFRTLNTKGLIRLKYNDGNSFCCLIADKGVEYLEEITTPALNQTEKPNYSVLGWCVFASFIGGFLGGAVSVVLSFLL